jgi:hypothetical protein
VLFAVWAVIASVLGITRENFPGTKRAMRLVAMISVLLAALAIGTAVYVGATEKKSAKNGGERGSVLHPL